MEASIDYELNLSTTYESTSFEETISRDSGKKLCRMNMMLSSIMGHGN